MIQRYGMLVGVLYFLFLVSTVHVCVANVVLVRSLGLSLTLSKAYSPHLASRLNFPTLSGPGVFVGDQCTFNVIDAEVPNGAVIFYTRLACDEGLPLQGFARLRSNIGAIVELYGSSGAIFENAGSDPNDSPPRFSFDPRGSKASLIYVRVHGSDAAKAADFFKTNQTMIAQVSYTHDPWKAMYYLPQWIIYEAVVIIFFCLYIPQHAIRALILLWRQRRKMPLHARQDGVNLQTVMMIAALFLGIVRIIEYSTQTLRDYGDIWSPEIISQLAWGYGYMILLLSMLLLVLYWADVMKTSRVKLMMIERVTTKFFVIFGVFGFVTLTIFIVLFVYELPGTT